MRKNLVLISLVLGILVICSQIASAKELVIEERTITFDDISKLDRSIVLDIPKDAEVSYFSFELTGPVAPGPDQPWNITLDLGVNGTIDWAFKHEYGPLGFQKIFEGNTVELESGLDPEREITPGAFYLPAFADVTEASVKLEGAAGHYLSPDVTELNRAEWHPEAPYDYDPEACVYNDRLYVAYRSYNWRDANQSDADIVMNSTADGVHWQKQITELSKAPDTEVPYTGGKRAGDFYPSLAVFKNKLYCAWESASILPNGSTHGEDRDILWTSYDGASWVPPEELTAPNEQAAEDVYSENPGLKDDYRVKLCTFDNGSGEQLFAIWTANNTGDEEFPEERKGDIIVSRTVDGEHWTVGLDLTDNDRRYDEDYLPQLVEFETPAGNALFAFWVSNNVKNTNGSDWDIVYRYTYDGVAWGEQYNLLQACNITEPADIDKAIDDDLAVIVFDGKLYALWRTSNPNISQGTDIDIVLSYTEDGLNWSRPIELTPTTDSTFNNRPRAAVYKSELAVVWRVADTQDGDSGAIVSRIFDPEDNKWTNQITISPPGEGGDDYSPDIITFNDRLMVTWVTQDNVTTRGMDADVVARWLVPEGGVPEVMLGLGDAGDVDDVLWVTTGQELSGEKTVTVDLGPSLRELLSDPGHKLNLARKDEYRNEVYLIPVVVRSNEPGYVRVSELKIQYNYSFLLPDLSEGLSELLKEISDKKSDSDGDENIQVKLGIGSATNGKLSIRNLKVLYTYTPEPEAYPELICIVVLGIVLIVAGVLIKLSRSKPAPGPKKPKQPLEPKKPES